MKKIGKAIVLAVLAWQVRRLQAKYAFKIVAIVGSYGKTSTKVAVATVLRQHLRVRFQAGNYNDITTAPLVLFGQDMPSLFNPVGWARIFVANEMQLHRPYPYDVVVLELGTDGPGQIAAFQRYLHVDIAIVTALGMEHMAFFANIRAVAAEELAIQAFSDTLMINADLCAPEYLHGLTVPVVSYGLDAAGTEYSLRDVVAGDGGTYHFTVLYNGTALGKATYMATARTQLYSAVCAAALADQLGVPVGAIAAGIAKVMPFSGRLQRLRGIKNSTILDDSYNAAPEAVIVALDALYRQRAPQKIALLGNMNELGDYAKAAHHDIGAHCDPRQLQLVITLGDDANAYLAPEAKRRGCTVLTTQTPYEAGELLKKYVQSGAAVLVKGSQNGVFSEEAIKYILADPADATRLVRQSPYWMKRKAKSFKHLPH
jgi:UDP-N-acetylmuramoyl-tripeptide--D-alanyl-D-alanine ligase